MRLLMVSDSHIRSKGPSSRVDDYGRTAVKKMAYVASLAIQLDAQIVHLGDVFHFKDPARTPYHLIDKLYREIDFGNKTPWVVAGNHDLQSSGMLSLHKQPLGILEILGIVRIPRESIVVGDVAFHFVHYTPAMELYLSTSPDIKIIQGKLNVLFTHAHITPTGAYDSLSYSNLLAHLSEFDYVFYGHMHRTWGMHDKMGLKIMSIPSLMRSSIASVSADELPRVVVFDTDSGEAIICPVPHEPHLTVFNITGHRLNKDRSDKLDKFVQSLTSMNIKSNSIIQALQEMRPNIRDEVYKELVGYLGEF